MATSLTESGHAVNLAHFNDLIGICTDFGDTYNPGNNDLSIDSMTALWNSGEEGQKALITAVAATKIPIGNRELLYKGLSPLVTRVMGAVNSSKASEKMKKDLKAKADAIRGYKKKKKVKEGEADKETTTADAADAELKKISQSQMGYVQRAKGFYEFIELLKTEPEYKVNEKDLQIESMEKRYADMKSMNDGMVSIINAAKTGMITRDRVLYAPVGGMIATARDCKSYVKGLYGANSPEWKLLTKLQFRDKRTTVKRKVKAVA